MAPRNDGDGKRAAEPRSIGAWLRDMPRWKKITVGVALTVAVVGGIWSLTSGDAPPAATSGGGDAGGLRTALIEGQPRSGGGSAATDEPTSKGVFRLGFSFLAGFCIGSFLRATLRVAAIAFGFWLLMTFLLSYYGLVVVDWDAMDALWNRFASNVEREWGSFTTFMTGSLPAAGLAAGGLAIGLKRH